jgi:aldehyde dehydrogenase (NAD+)
MPYCPQTVQQQQQALARAIEQCDAAAFNQEYLQFLHQFDAFDKAYSKHATSVAVENVIFGQLAFHLHPTTDTQAQHLLSEARAASQVFAHVPITDRLQFLQMLEQALVKYQDAIMTTISADTGKPLDLSRGEIGKGTEWFDYARAQAEIQLGTKQVGKVINGTHPLGCVQVISAYNYPLALSIGGLVGGLAAGNGVIISAPMKAPNWVFPFMSAVKEATSAFITDAKTHEKPWATALEKHATGLIQYSIGVNHHLTTNVDIVHFVGSDIVGAQIRAARNGKPTLLEISGSNVVSVMKSALNTANADDIAKTIYGGFGPATGQRCTAPRILCIQKGAEAVAHALNRICADGPASHEIGNPFQPGVKIGPLVDKIAYFKMQDAIALAKTLGATVYGKLRPDETHVPLAAFDKACWVNPVTIDWSTASLSHPETQERMEACMQDEIFGPLLHILPAIETVAQVTQAIATLDTHRLAAALFSNDTQEVEAFLAGINVTSIAINGPTKDLSPWGSHGHPGLQTIGGATHFHLYAGHISRTVTGI